MPIAHWLGRAQRHGGCEVIGWTVKHEFTKGYRQRTDGNGHAPGIGPRVEHDHVRTIEFVREDVGRTELELLTILGAVGTIDLAHVVYIIGRRVPGDPKLDVLRRIRGRRRHGTRYVGGDHARDRGFVREEILTGKGVGPGVDGSAREGSRWCSASTATGQIHRAARTMRPTALEPRSPTAVVLG